MTVAAYVALLANRFGVVFGLRRNRLVYVSQQRLPRDARNTLKEYRDAVLAYLTSGGDAHLVNRNTGVDWTELGLFRMPSGRWTHPEGDDRALEIVAGLVPPEQAKHDAVDRYRDWVRPPRVEVQAVEVHPGLYRWTEYPGVRTVPMFNGRPLIRE